MKKKIEEMGKLREDLAKCERLKKELEVQNVTLLEQKNDLYLQLQTEQDAVADLEERVEKLVTQKADFESQIKEMEERLLDEEDAAAELEVIKRKMEGENDELKKDIEDLENSLAKVGYVFWYILLCIIVFNSIKIIMKCKIGVCAPSQ